jgi:diguanylate cyclase (GGDEF)-like protein
MFALARRRAARGPAAGHDHFKRINDHGGHEAGDRALQLVARVLMDTVRRGDIVCRYGGEEFCVLVTRGGAPAAQEVDRRLRRSLHEHQSFGPDIVLDFSSGLAVLIDEDAGLGQVIRRADNALYEAKAAGRGQLVMAAGLRSVLRQAEAAALASQTMPKPPSTSRAVSGGDDTSSNAVANRLATAVLDMLGAAPTSAQPSSPTPASGAPRHWLPQPKGPQPGAAARRPLNAAAELLAVWRIRPSSWPTSRPSTATGRGHARADVLPVQARLAAVRDLISTAPATPT